MAFSSPSRFLAVPVVLLGYLRNSDLLHAFLRVVLGESTWRRLVSDVFDLANRASF